jgi:hypothetical protein
MTWLVGTADTGDGYTRTSAVAVRVPAVVEPHYADTINFGCCCTFDQRGLQTLLSDAHAAAA